MSKRFDTIYSLITGSVFLLSYISLFVPFLQMSLSDGGQVSFYCFQLLFASEVFYTDSGLVYDITFNFDIILFAFYFLNILCVVAAFTMTRGRLNRYFCLILSLALAIATFFLPLSAKHFNPALDFSTVTAFVSPYLAFAFLLVGFALCLVFTILKELSHKKAKNK